MDRAQPFSVLNERLRPQFTTTEQIYSSLNRLEDRQLASIRSKTSQRSTILPAKEPEVSLAEPADPEETEAYAEQDDGNSDEGNCAELLDTSSSTTELNVNDTGEEDLTDDSKSISSSEEKDQPGELTSVAAGHSSESAAQDGEGGSSFQRSYINGTLPDLVNTGKLLGRRRTLGHVSETLKEVRREVELSRRRSIKLKAQVDKLQENRDGVGWGQHRERVTEELQSVLRLLTPLTQSGCPATPSPGENRLDASMSQLQSVARELAISHTKQSKSEKGTEDSAILQQALRDRDEAIEKKKAMEAELLRSKTELMMLNNQLLEAVQKRLELALELETWREDVQRILHQQLQSKQEAEQAQKKPSRLGILRRNKQPPIQRPTTFPLAAPVSPTTNPNQIYVPRSVAPATAVPPSPGPTSPPAGTQTVQRNWRDRLRRNKNSRQGDQDAAVPESEVRGDDGFQVVLLD